MTTIDDIDAARRLRNAHYFARFMGFGTLISFFWYEPVVMSVALCVNAFFWLVWSGRLTSSRRELEKLDTGGN